MCLGLSVFSLSSIRKRFEKNQEDCTATVGAIVPAVKDVLMSLLKPEEV